MSDYLADLRVSERELDHLASFLDAPVSDNAHAVATLALAHRSRSYFRGFRYCVEGPEPTAAMPLLRPLVEINILLRFFACSPVLHVALWHAESDRTMLALHNEYSGSASMRARWGGAGPLSEDQRALLLERVEQARALAIEAGLPVGAKGPVLPSVVHQLDVLNDDGAREGYTLAYRPLSSDVHGGAFAFVRGEYEVMPYGLIQYAEPTTVEDLRAARTLGLTTFASTLAIVSDVLDLGLEDEIDVIKHRYVPRPATGSHGGGKA